MENKMKANIHNSLLIQATQLCVQRNVRMTPQRLKVLRLMSEQQNAISAYDLLDLLRQSEPQAKPSTIYRALDFLLQQKFVHRVESTNSFVLCHHFSEPSHISVFLICNQCGSVAEQTTKDIKDVLQCMVAAGFSVSHTVIEVHGCCHKCTKI